MRPTRPFLTSSAILCAAFLTAIPAGAEEFGARLMPLYRPAPDPQHMPGWDWERTYPWSPYNYGRNPYNPIITPYPYPYYPSPYYGPAYGPQYAYGPGNVSAPDGATFPTQQGQPVLMPHPTGELRVPPPGAAIVQVRVPDVNAHVLFDGERTYTMGTNRYFVTPELPNDKPYHYTVSASWSDGGDNVSKERKVEVTAGNTTVIDFTRPDKK